MHNTFVDGTCYTMAKGKLCDLWTAATTTRTVPKTVTVDKVVHTMTDAGTVTTAANCNTYTYGQTSALTSGGVWGWIPTPKTW